MTSAVEALGCSSKPHHEGSGHRQIRIFFAFNTGKSHLSHGSNYGRTVNRPWVVFEGVVLCDHRMGHLVDLVRNIRILCANAASHTVAVFLERNLEAGRADLVSADSERLRPGRSVFQPRYQLPT